MMVVFVVFLIIVDLEPNVDDVRNEPFSNIFHPEYLLSGKEDAANNFARGHYSVGKENIDKVNNRLRKLADNCDNVQGFVIKKTVSSLFGFLLGSGFRGRWGTRDSVQKQISEMKRSHSAAVYFFFVPLRKSWAKGPPDFRFFLRGRRETHSLCSRLLVFVCLSQKAGPKGPRMKKPRPLRPSFS